MKANLIRSVVEEVRWHDTALRLLSYDLDRVVEFGASNVLGALMKRLPDAPAVSVVSDFDGAQKLRVEIERATEAPV
jgi:malonyl CoA-acyl carrier protein transacylase